MIIAILKVSGFFKLIQILILSAVKFLLAAPLSFKFGFTYIQTMLATTIGGILGVIFFFYLSEIILRIFKREWPHIKSFFNNNYNELKPIAVPISNNKNKKKFSKKNKFIVLTRRKYGLWGIAALTPILLSIPFGTFLANKYYRNKKSVLFSLALSVVCWSIIMSSIYAIFKIKPF